MSEMSSHSVIFECYLDRLVLNLTSQGITSFDKLLLALPSVYPSVLLKTLERLVAESKLPSWILRHADGIVKLPPQNGGERYQDTILPIPHPLDYEWRFTKNAIQRLLNTIMAFSEAQDTIALLGVPSVFYEAVTKRTCARSLVLVDTNTSAIAHLARIAGQASIIECDILHGQLTDMTAKVVVIDAPWYPLHIRAFLRAASQICLAGGSVLVSMPPVGTRPGMEAEWQEIIEYAGNINLHLKEFYPLELPYLSPPFERNALKAEGITNYPYDWRRGDLVIFSHPGNSNLPPAVPVPTCTGWIEENIEGVRIRVCKQVNGEFEDPTLLSLVPGDILPSVSRRDPRRDLANVWTSGNRIYKCRGGQILKAILRARAQHRDPKDEVAQDLGRRLTHGEKHLLVRAIQQVEYLVQTERSEMLCYVS